MTTAYGKIATQVIEKGVDLHMGRWSYLTLLGKANKRVMFITAYRVCQQHDPGPETAFFHQWNHLRQHGIIDPDPHQQMLDDLAIFIKERTATGYDVVLGLDGNESLGTDSALSAFFADTGLFCFHESMYSDDYYLANPLPNTHKRGRGKIDFQAGTINTLPWALRCGWEAFDEGLGGDHRTGFVDFQMSGLLGHITDIDRAATRTLRSNNIKIVRAYRIELHRVLSHHNITQRIERLHIAAQANPFNKQMHLEIERIDRTVRESKLAAEKHCRNRFLHDNWSPKLVQHALTQKFWKVLLSSKKNNKDATHVLQPLIAKLSALSTNDLSSTTTEIITRLQGSRAEYKAAKDNAKQLRAQFLQELAAVWARRGRTDIATAIRCIEDSMKTREAHAYITRVFKPRTSNGLNAIKVPTVTVTSDTTSTTTLGLTYTEMFQ